MLHSSCFNLAAGAHIPQCMISRKRWEALSRLGGHLVLLLVQSLDVSACTMFCRAACRLIWLNAFVASTSRTASALGALALYTYSYSTITYSIHHMHVFWTSHCKNKDVLLIWEAPLLSCKNTSCCTSHTTDGVHMGICTCLHVVYFIINCRNYVHITLALSCYGHQQILLYHLSSSNSLSLDVPLSGNNYVRLQPLTAVSIQFIPV